jgi:hypothetical protein
MAEYAGSALVLSWIWSGGTVDLAAHTRQFTFTPNQTTIDATAGSDANRQHLPSFVDYTVAAQGVAQNGADGTIMAQALKAGVEGTLIAGPYGTASNSLKYTVPAFSLGIVHDSPYADVSTWACDFNVSSGGSVTIGFYA